ncbi:hypothetical protein GF319_08280 [Candidatus Bathyarchaeota archaeon]|nr:hypothetical protein [Candidatus Bathyarchaeota archaeon]
MVSLTDHAAEKIEKELFKFSITQNVEISTVQRPDNILYDTQTGRFVALNWDKRIAVIYEENGDIILIITLLR